MSNLLYNLAQPFSDTKQYTQGTIVVHNDRMYEMTASDYTPGAFNPEKFTERFLSEMMSGKLNSNLGGLTLTNLTVSEALGGSVGGAEGDGNHSLTIDVSHYSTMVISEVCTTGNKAYTGPDIRFVDMDTNTTLVTMYIGSADATVDISAVNNLGIYLHGHTRYDGRSSTMSIGKVVLT